MRKVFLIISLLCLMPFTMWAQAKGSSYDEELELAYGKSPLAKDAPKALLNRDGEGGLELNWGYCFNLPAGESGSMFCFDPTSNPLDLQNLKDYEGFYITAAEVVPYNSTIDIIYAYTSDGRFGTIDPQTREFTTISSGLEPLFELAYNVKTGLMYGLRYGILYQINMANGQLMTVNNSQVGSNDWIALGIDSQGNMYGITNTYSTQNAALYSINQHNWNVTMIGNVPYKTQYSQTMTFNRTTDELYWWQTSSSGSSLLRVNPATAGCSPIALYNGYQMVGMLFKYAPEGFDITYGTYDHGTVTGPNVAAAHDMVELTVTPDDGYRLLSLSYNGTPIDITGSGPYYHFEMPEGPVQISAIFGLSIHNIVVIDPKDGTLATDPAEQGSFTDTITILPTTDPGFAITSVTVTDGTNTTTLTEEPWEFEMPDNDVTVSAQYYQTGVNTFVIDDDYVGFFGQTVTIGVELNNENYVTPVQMDIALGEHLTYVANSAALTERAAGEGWTITANVIAGNVLRVTVFCANIEEIQKFNGNTGDIFTFQVVCDNVACVNPMVISAEGLVAATPDNTRLTVTKTDGSIEIFAITMNQPENVEILHGQTCSAIEFTTTIDPEAGVVSYEWTNSQPSIGLAANGTGNLPEFQAVNNTGAPVVATIEVTPILTIGEQVLSGGPVSFTITVLPAVYSITVIDPADGTLATDPVDSAYYNTPVTVLPTPDPGFEVNTITVTANGEATEITEEPWEFTMPMANVTVSALYTQNGVNTFVIADDYYGYFDDIVTVDVELNNDNYVSAVQMDITLGENLTYVANSVALTDRAEGEGWIIGANTLANNTLRITAFCGNTQTIGHFSGNTGAIFSFDLACGRVAGDNPLTFVEGSIVASTPDNTRLIVTKTDGSLEIRDVVMDQPASIAVCHNTEIETIEFTSPIEPSEGEITYAWTNSETAIGLAAEGTGDIEGFTAVNTTTATLVANLTVTPTLMHNGHPCVGSTKEFTITVYPKVEMEAVANQTVCAGDSIMAIEFATAITDGTVTFAWTNDNTAIGLAAEGEGDIAAFVGTNTTGAPLVANIEVTPTYTNEGMSCVGEPINFTLTINPMPVVEPVDDIVVCNGDDIEKIVFNTNITEGRIVVGWRCLNPTIGCNPTGVDSIPAFTAVNNGTAAVSAWFTVIPVYMNNYVICMGDSINFTVTVNPTPVMVEVEDVAVCANDTVQAIEFATNITDGEVTYAWTNDNEAIGLAAEGTGNIAAFIGTNTTGAPLVANVEVTPTYTNNGISCVGEPISFTITVNPMPVMVAVESQVICANDTIQAIAFASNITDGNVTYAWTNDNTAIGLAAEGTGDIAAFIALNATGAPIVANIEVTPTYTNNGISCVGEPISFTITVNPMPVMVAVESQVVCAGTEIEAIVFESNITDGNVTYAWTNDNEAIGLAAEGTGDIAAFTALNTTGAPLVANVEVTPTYTNNGISCVGEPISFTITVNPMPVMVAVESQVVCANDTIQAIAFESNITDGNVTYAWTNDNTAIGLAAEGTGNIAAFIGTNTTGAPLVANIEVTPTYTNNGISCVGEPISFTITVNPMPVMVEVADQILCAGAEVEAITFASNITDGNVTYAWTNDNTAIGLAAEGTGNIAAFTALNTTGAPLVANVEVTPTYTNNGISCVGEPISFTITVNPMPVMVAVESQVVCAGAEVEAIAFASNITDGNVTYAWTNDNTAIGLAAEGTGDIAAFTALNTTGAPLVANVEVTPTYTNAGVSCVGEPISFTITVNPMPVMVEVADQILCAGAEVEAITFASNITDGNVTYAWTNDNTAIGLAAEGTGNIASFTALNTTGAPLVANVEVTPTYTNNGISCVGEPISFTITVNPMPVMVEVADQILCAGAEVEAITFASNITDNNVTYAWTNDNTAIGLAAEGTGDIAAFTALNTTGAPIVANIVVTPTYTNNGISCVGEPVSFTITVNPMPVMVEVADQILCAGAEVEAIAFASNITDNNVTYAWTNDNAAIGLAAEGTGNIAAFTALNTTGAPIVANIVVTPTYSNQGVSCVGEPVSFTITVNPTPVMVEVADQVVCDGAEVEAITFASNITDSNVTYAWTNDNTTIGLAAEGTGNIAAFVGVNTTNTVQVATVTVVPTYLSNGVSCEGEPITFTITVNPTVVMNVPADQEVYSRESTAPVVFTSNIAEGVTYAWTNDNTAIGLAASGTGNIPSFIAAAPITETLVATITVVPTYTNANVACVGEAVSFTITVNPTYLVVCNEAINGTITDNASVAANGEHYAYPGQLITLTTTPAQGYFLENVVVTKLEESTVIVPVVDDQFFTMPEYDVQCNATFIDGNSLLIKPGVLDLGYRPINAWMYSKFFDLINNTDDDIEVSHIDLTSHNFFELDEVALPFTIESGDADVLGINTNYKTVAPGLYTTTMALIANSRRSYTRQVIAHAYTAVEPDIWELATTVNNFPYTTTQTTGGVLYDNYQLPGDNPDGYDGVYKLVLTNDMVVNATMTYGENTKLVVYDEDFRQVGGPHIDNYYNAPMVVENSALIGDGSTTTTYAPYFTYYNNSLCQILYTADELTAAGLVPGEINSIEFNTADTYGYTRNLNIWMANVTAGSVSSTSLSTANMPQVFAGDYTQVEGWNKIVFNGAQFEWDGTSNILVTVDMTASSWGSRIYWTAHNPGFAACAYVYNDYTDYQPAQQTYTMTTSSTVRPDIKINGADFVIGDGMVMGDGNIVDLPLMAGTYYLVASTTSDDHYTLEINAEDMPLPLAPTAIYPLHGQQGVPTPVTMQWEPGEYTHEYQVILGLTYPPTQVVVDWTDDLTGIYNAGELLHNTIYYWRVNERNSTGVTEGPLWVFTTELNVPENLTVVDDEIFEGENAVLNWISVNDRTIRGYNIYQDGVKINDNPVTGTTYTVSGLTYNMEGYEYYVTAKYDEGESEPSNTVVVYVSGEGTIAGHVYEQDGVTGIANAEVLITGVDEFGDTQIHSGIYTNASGAYSVNVPAGSYLGVARKEGYQPALNSNVAEVVYNQTTNDYNFIMNEVYYPVGKVIAEEISDENVHVFWMWQVPFEGLMVDFADGQTPEGWTLTGDWIIANTCTSSWGFFEGTMPEPPFMYINSDDAGSGVLVTGTFTSPVIDAQYCESLTLEFDHYAYAAYGDVCEVQVSTDGNTWTTVQAYTGTTVGSFASPAHASIDLSNYLSETLQIRFYYTDDNSWLYGWAIDNISLSAGEDAGDRSFASYRVYRRNTTDLSQAIMMAEGLTVEEYYDATWGQTPAGVYQWGVSAVYEGNRGESEIIWSNTLDKAMYAEVSVQVTTNSNDDVTGAQVVLTNVSEPDLALVYQTVLDETGLYTWDEFRKGEYVVNINLDGYEPFETTASVWNSTTLSYVLTEIVSNIDELYVSTTGWAMFGTMPTPPPTPVGETFFDDFENGMDNWTVVDADGDGDTWQLGTPASYGIGDAHSGTNVASSWSWNNYTMDPDNYMISPEVPGAVSVNYFVAVNTGYPDHYGIYASSTGTNISDFTLVFEETAPVTDGGMLGGIKSSMTSAGNRAMSSWNERTVELPAGTKYVAFRHYDSYDMNYLFIDDVTISTGRNDRAVQYYTVKLDGNIEGITTHPFFQHDVEGFTEGEMHTTAVQAVYGTGESEWVEFEWQYTPCDNFAGLQGEPTADWAGDDVVLNWVLPEGTGPVNPPTGGDEFTEGFENGIPSDWALIDADGDGRTWNLLSAFSGTAHTGNDGVYSQSYDNNYGVLYPDNYIVSHQVTLGGTFSFWACAQDNLYAAEHFGVAVSTGSQTNAADFTTIQEWTLTAKGEGMPTNVTRSGNRTQGNWYQYTVDLSSYAGQTGYIAIRHFNCSDMFYIDVDDVELSSSKSREIAIDESFEAGIPSGWAMIDADGDGRTWNLLSAFSGTAHTGNDGIYSQSYDNNYGVLYPDNYIVTSQVALGGTFSFWACAQDNLYAAEHFGVAVSTGSQTNAADFTTVQEWTMTAKGNGTPTNVTRSGNRTQGNWYQYTVDLSSYAGQTGYIAIRHFNCSDMFYLDVDDVVYETSGGSTPVVGGGIIGVEIFRDGEWIAEVPYPAETYTDVNPGLVDEYEIRVIHDGYVEDWTYYAMSCPQVAVVGEYHCQAPENLVGDYLWTPENFGAILGWTYGEEPVTPAEFQWYYYDNGNNEDAIGTGGGEFWWGVMFPAGSYEGGQVAKVAAYDYMAMSGDVTIYNDGANAPANAVGSTSVTFTGSMDFVEFQFSTPVNIDPTKNVWVVFHNASGATYPAAVCPNTGDANGRWVSLDGATWEDLASYGLDYTFMIRAYIGGAKGAVTVLGTTPEPIMASGSFSKAGQGFGPAASAAAIDNVMAGDPIYFNVYRDGDVIATVPFTGEYEYSYYDIAEIGTYDYQVTAVYEDGCESPFALTPDLEDDYVTVFVDAVDEITNVNLYPNPTTGNVTIEAAGMNHITVVSVLGQVVYDADITADMTTLSLGQYKAGVYVVRINTENGVRVKRVTVVK